jgi:signal transduction histidine kinase
LADRARLLRSATFRLVVSYLSFFLITSSAMLAGVYWTASNYIDRQMGETIDAEITGLSERYRQQGLRGLIQVIGERSAAERDRKSLYLLADELFRPITGNLLGWPEEEPDAEGRLHFSVQHLTPAGLQTFRAAGRVFVLPGSYRLLVGRSLQETERMKTALSHAIAVGLALTVLLGLAGGIVTSRGFLQRVDGINRTMRRIMAGDISQRVARRRDGDEFDQLAAGINAALDEIETLVGTLRTVTDNVAHDLRTPLHRLRSRIDVALLGEPDAEAYRRTLEETMADADRLLATFNALLTIAQAEGGARANQLQLLDLVAVVRDVVELYEPLAEDKGLVLTLDAPAEAPARGDRHLLSQALANLIDNAVKYTPEGGRVTVRIAAGPEPKVEVADNGPGIPEDERGRVLEPFARLDATRSTPGNGLGLSLVAAVARLHGAELELGDNAPGLVVRLRFSGDK